MQRQSLNVPCTRSSFSVVLLVDDAGRQNGKKGDGARVGSAEVPEGVNCMHEWGGMRDA